MISEKFSFCDTEKIAEDDSLSFKNADKKAPPEGGAGGVILR
jgi:hypothetical protein